MSKGFTNQWMLAVAATLLIGTAGISKAAVLYSSPADYTKTSYSSTTASGGEQECTPFTLGTGATITQVNFWGDYFDGTLVADSFIIGLYPGSTVPGATALATTVLSALTRVDTGLTAARGLETYFYTATLTTPFVVTGGTGYSVAVLNATSTWDWQLGGAGTNFYRIGADGTAWSTSASGTQDSIQLIGNAVPEPSSWALLGLGGAGLLGLGLRQRHLRAA